ncbi:EP300-interacting inhibitor of differentiation 3 [Elephas maximus indicus]|uniref:EP300-interacting inhibitor of differentiation 3 n=1 Tax=Elephas maximus indicus TaxID=99487 RepID=UPI002116578E|nr:EP300-interacting inhibitor of differentiation 3 [Elephas maximus indicus]
MSTEKDSQKEGEERRQEPEPTITGSEYPPNRAEGEGSMNVVAVRASGRKDSFNFGKVFLDPALEEPEGDEEEYRSIRKQYRALIYQVQDQRHDIVNTANESLTEALEEANGLFDGVTRTREAALDAQFLVMAADLGKEKSRQLRSDVSLFNQAAFCDFLFTFVGVSGLEEKHDRLDDGDEGRVRYFWETLQRKAASWTLRAETFHFMLGSFNSEPSVPRPRQRRRRVRSVEEKSAMPKKLKRMDLNNNQETTEREVERILGLLQTYFRMHPNSSVSYFEFVVDPHSFARTVENIFYVSFIIRDGYARISLDQDRLPVLQPVSNNQMGEEYDSGPSGMKQGIISLSLQDWRNIVATFQISKPMITKE